MSDSPNPYESPRGLDPQAARDAVSRDVSILRGHFIADEKLFRKASRWLRTGQKVSLAFGVVLLHIVPIGFALAAIMAEFGTRGQGIWPEILGYSGFASPVALIVVGCLSYERGIKANCQRLADRFGKGKWQVTVDEFTFHLETPTGVHKWPLSQLRPGKGSYDPLILWLEPNLSIAIPSTGDCDAASFDDVVLTIRRRIAT